MWPLFHMSPRVGGGWSACAGLGGPCPRTIEDQRAGQPPSFQELLVQLAQAHEREVRLATLRGANAASHQDVHLEVSEEMQPLEPDLRKAASADLAVAQPKESGQDSDTNGDLAASRPSFAMKHEWLHSNLEKINSICTETNGEWDGYPNPRLSEVSVAQAISRCPKHCVIFPNSSFRLCWDLVGLVFILYDLLIIPFHEAFETGDDPFTVFMDWATLLFWTADMIQGFFLGYFEQGEYVTSNALILKHYVRTWFLVDLIVVAPGWFTQLVSVEDSAGATGASRLLKAARACRVLRLLRLAKVQRVVNMLYDLIENEYSFILINLVRLLIMVVMMSHVVACVWFLIGRLSAEQGMLSWIAVSGLEGTDLPYKYSTSLHWSLTQFTPASVDISARNVLERMFSIVVLLFAMVVFSSIVGSISGSMTSLRSIKSDNLKQFWLLRRYLRQRSVSNHLSGRILKFLEHQVSKQINVVQGPQVVILRGLSDSLQNELTHQLHSPFLMEHPFFCYLDQEMPVVMHRLCRQALRQQPYAEDEAVFTAGDNAKQAFFVTSGFLEYTTTDGQRLRPPPGVKDWIGEAVLWTAWRHRGSLHSLMPSELISVDPGQFVEVMGVHPRSWFYAKHYGEAFVEFINGVPRHKLLDVLREDFYLDAVEHSLQRKGGGSGTSE